MTSSARNWIRTGLFVSLVAIPAAVFSADRSTKNLRKPNPDHRTVEMFAAMAADEITAAMFAAVTADEMTAAMFAAMATVTTVRGIRNANAAESYRRRDRRNADRFQNALHIALLHMLVGNRPRTFKSPPRQAVPWFVTRNHAAAPFTLYGSALLTPHTPGTTRP